MALESQQVTVGTSATQLADAEGDGQIVYVNNKHSAAIFLGGASVTTTNGYEVANGVRERIELSPGEALFAVMATASGPVHVLRTNAG